jgi:hypothetical protein
MGHGEFSLLVVTLSVMGVEMQGLSQSNLPLPNTAGCIVAEAHSCCVMEVVSGGRLTGRGITAKPEQTAACVRRCRRRDLTCPDVPLLDAV